jgi:hypothetical protein
MFAYDANKIIFDKHDALTDIGPHPPLYSRSKERVVEYQPVFFEGIESTRFICIGYYLYVIDAPRQQACYAWGL